VTVAILAVPGIGRGNNPRVINDLTGPGTQDIDFYLPEVADGSAPLIVIFHGGGDHGNDGLEPLAATLADRGAVVAVPPYFSGQPRSQNEVRQTFENVICSIRYARTRAAEFGADPASLTVVGFSYGGYPATALALASEDAYDFDCLEGISHIPQTVVGLGGAYYYDPKVTTLGWSEPFSEFTSLGNLGNNQGVRVSLVHGSRDTNSPVDHAESLYTKLEAAGYAVALEILDTRHAELIDPSDPAGARVVEVIMDATGGGTTPGRRGPATTSVYAQLEYQSR